MNGTYILRKISSKEKCLNDLNEARTCELVRELSTRLGVEIKTAEPYQDLTVTVNGPAIVLIITD